MLDLHSLLKTPMQGRSVGNTGLLIVFLTFFPLAPLAVSGPGLSRSLAAQTTDQTPRIGCLRGRPLPACQSFWLLEMQAVAPVVQSRRLVDRGAVQAFEEEPWRFAFEWNIGHMWNVGEDWAFGGVVTAATNVNGVLGGLRGRARRWLTDDLSIESSFGYMRMDGRSLSTLNDHGVSADLRLNIRDQGAFFLRWDHLRIAETRRDQFGQSYYDPGGAQNALLVGVSTGSVPALVSTGTLMVGLAILVGLLIASDT